MNPFISTIDCDRFLHLSSTLRAMSKIDELISLISTEDYVYLQTHDFPDFDAVASAFGLHYLLSTQDIRSFPVYVGQLRSAALIRMVKSLRIPIRPAHKEPLRPRDKLILIDGCRGNNSMTHLPGEEIAVIDHRPGPNPEEARFMDLRPEAGSSSSIIHSYFESLEVTVPPKVATALMIGLLVDTSHMTKGVSQEDVNTYTSLYDVSDGRLVNDILKKRIQRKDLDFYKIAMENIRIRDRLAYCYFPKGCNENLIGVMGDFFLTLAEVDCVFLCAKNGSRLHLSLRSEKEYWNAAEIVHEVLSGIGFGGGHDEFATGILTDVRDFHEADLYRRLRRILKKAKADRR